jgi:Lipid-droplet associated hydrolase
MLRRAHFALFVSCLAYTLTLLLPGPIVRWLVGRVTRFPSSAVASTASFISRPYSVRQALHLARFEMDEITEDRWADDIWHAGKDGPQLTFLFGDEDHWVAADARDELIRSRRATEGRPGARMEIDEMQVPHSFCIRDSKVVADRTSKIVRQVIKPS